MKIKKIIKSSWRLVSLVLTVSACMASSSFAASNSPLPTEPMVIQGAHQSELATPYVVDVDLRDLPKTKDWKMGDPIIEIPKRVYQSSQGPDIERTSQLNEPLFDPLLDLQENAVPDLSLRAFSTPNLNFDGQGFTGVYPPDTVGEVGLNYYIQLVNAGGGTIFNVYNKSDGSLAAGPSDLDSLWTGGGACASGYGDPIVLFDTLANRWLMSEFASSGNHLCVYISKTSDPISGGWYLYDFNVPQFPDYPKYAVWPDAYYVSTNESSPAAYALDRNRMLNGQSATFQRFTAPNMPSFPFQALIPSDVDGTTSPPAGSPNYFMRHRDGEINGDPPDPLNDILEIWEFRVDWNNPANSTFTGPVNVTVSDFDSYLCGLSSFYCFPQPGTSVTLDPLREVVMWRLQYRNFGSYETLVGNFVTDLDRNHGGIRWFELRKTDGSWSLYQEGTYGPDEAHRWMGSIAMDKDGNMALGYSVSSTTIYPSIRYVGRLASDTLGTMPQGEYTLVSGTASQTASTRWGDYSSMNVDPVDDCTFWYTNEYITTGGTWRTRISSFNFPSCEPSIPPITQTITPPSDTTVAPGDVLGPFTVSQTNNTSSSYRFFENHYLIGPDTTVKWWNPRRRGLPGDTTRTEVRTLLTCSWCREGIYTYGILLTDTNGSEIDDDSFEFTVTSP